MTGILIEALTSIDPNEQAQRAADAGWETARWTWWLFFATAALVLGAVAAAWYARKTWIATQKSLRATKESLGNSEKALEATEEQLTMARTAERRREAVNVSAWLTMKKTVVHMMVRNGNDGPVYDVRCRISGKPDGKNNHPSEEINRWHVLALSPSGDGANNDSRVTLGPEAYVKGPREGQRTEGTKSEVIFTSTADWRLWDGDPATTGLGIELDFRDSTGVLWHRSWNGSLSERSGSLV